MAFKPCAQHLAECVVHPPLYHYHRKTARRAQMLLKRNGSAQSALGCGRSPRCAKSKKCVAQGPVMTTTLSKSLYALESDPCANFLGVATRWHRGVKAGRKKRTSQLALPLPSVFSITPHFASHPHTLLS